MFQYWKNRMFYGEKFKITFACKFNFTNFPFDSHECPLEFGADNKYTSKVLRHNSSHIMYESKSNRIGEPPIILEDLPFPFEFQLESLAAFEKVSTYGRKYSYTGMLIRLRRKSLGQLLSGYYYPMGSFALISMASYLIKPKVVSLEHNKSNTVLPYIVSLQKETQSFHFRWSKCSLG